VIRRSFRRGIAFGLLVGTAAPAVKTVLDRRSPRPATPSGPATQRWDPIPDTTPVTIPEAPAPSPAKPSKPPAKRTEKTPAAKEPAKEPTKRTESKPAPPWVEPTADGTCPDTHPVKAKMASGIYHVPGGLNYPRTRPDRCYIDAAAAEADGLRPSKR
jgi:hypothetical protein